MGIKEIAKIANVSVSTVSNALKGKPNVSEATRQRILHICKENGYTPNINAQKLKAGKSQLLAFNFSNFDRVFYLEIMHGIQDCLQTKEYDLVLCTHTETEKMLKNRLIDGMLVLNHHVHTEDVLRMSQEIPVVFLDRFARAPHVRSCVSDNFTVMSELITTLVERGYRSFHYINGLQDTLDNTDRRRALETILARENIPMPDSHFFAGDYSEASGYHATRIMIMARKLPECIVCANDLSAFGAVRALTEAGIRVPEDVAVTGFDDEILARYLNPPLTTVSVPRYELGFTATMMLIDLIDARHMEDQVLSSRVLWRSSTR